MTHTTGRSVLRPYGLQTEQRYEPLGLGEARAPAVLEARLRPARRRAERVPDHRRRSALATSTTRPGCCGTAAGASPATACSCPGTARCCGRPPGTTGGSRSGMRPAPRPASAQSWFETGLLHREDWTAVWVGRDPARPATGRPAAGGRPSPSTRLVAAAAVPAPRVRAGRAGRCGRGSTPPPAVSTSPGSTARGSATPSWRRAGRSTTAGCSTRPTTSPRCCARAATCSAPSSPTAGGAGTSASTRAAPRTTTATPGLPGPAGARLRRRLPAGGGHRRRLDRAARRDPVRRPADGRARRRPPTACPAGTRPARLRRLPAGRGARHRTRAAGRRARPPGPGHPRRAAGRGAPARPGPVHRRLRTEPGRPGAADRPGRRARGGGSSCGTPRSSPTASCTWTTCAAPEATDVYTTGGGETEVFEPQFTFHGFRYVEVDNYPGELSGADVVARVLHSDTPWTGHFECSDPMVNQLQSNIAWGQRGNFVAVPTDCPQRDERLGWLADAQIFAPTASRNADVSAFFARWMRDVRRRAGRRRRLPRRRPGHVAAPRGGAGLGRRAG